MASIFKRDGQGAWCISYVDHAGRRRTRSSRTTDKRAAERIARQLEADAALRREGVIDPRLDDINAESIRPLEHSLSGFCTKMRAAHRTDKHVESTRRYVQIIADYNGWRTVAQIAADGVLRFAAHLRDSGRSVRTIQAHLIAIKGFTRWLTETDKVLRDPLLSVKKPNPVSARARERRMLLPEEWPWLVRGVSRIGEIASMPAEVRVALYAMAVQTGLRASELRSLTPARLFLDADPPYVTCKAGATKNRQGARQYIKPDLALAMKRIVRDRCPGTSAFGLTPHARLAHVLHTDLAAARDLWLDGAATQAERQQRARSDFLLAENHDREVLDFHSLRHTCGSWLAMAGAHPKAVQSIMRHSSIVLTMDTYGHLFPGQEADAVARLPRMLDTAETEPDARSAFVSAHGAAGHDSMRAHAMAQHRCR